MEIKTEVKTFKIQKQCPSCKTGFLIANGSVFPMSSPIFSHNCDSCNLVFTFSKAYPYFEYEPIKNDSTTSENNNS